MASTWLVVILTILGILAVVGFIIYQIVISNKEGKIKGVRENAPRFKNFARCGFTNGYFEGIVLKDILRKNDCHYFEIYPTDVETGEGKKKPRIQNVVYHKDNLRRFPRGSLSSETEQIFGIGNSQAEVPDELIDTSLGKWLGKEGELSFLKKTVGQTIPKAQETLSSVMSDWTGLGATATWLAEMRERVAEIEKAIPKSLLQKEDDKMPPKKE